MKTAIQNLNLGRSRKGSQIVWASRPIPGDRCLRRANRRLAVWSSLLLSMPAGACSSEDGAATREWMLKGVDPAVSLHIVSAQDSLDAELISLAYSIRDLARLKGYWEVPLQ